MTQTLRTAKDTSRSGRKRRWVLWPLYSLLLGVATYRALALLPSPWVELQRLGLVDTLPLSPGAVRLGIAALAAVLFTVLPPAGGVVALLAPLLPLAFLNVGLAGIYAVLALFCLPCLARREGVLVLLLVPLALAYPGFALFLPLVPVLAGLLCGRLLGPYTAAIAAVALIVLGLVTGQATVGGVAVDGDREPLMASEGMRIVAERAPLMPSRLSEKPDFVEGFRGSLDAGSTGRLLAWLWVMLHWWVPVCLGGTALALLELVPRLLSPHLLAVVILWAAVGSGTSWLVWLVERRASTGWHSRRSEPFSLA